MLAGLLALGVAAVWVVVSFVPIRDAEGGPFLGSALTPAKARALSRKAIPDASWPMFGASPARSRFVVSGLRPPFHVVHRIPGESLIEMPPAVSQGRVVFGTHDGLVIAARASDGTRAWTTDIRGCIASSPAVRGGIVYIGWSGSAPCARGKDRRGGVVALGLASGRVLWRFNAGNVEASPAIVADRLFFSAFRSRRESQVFAMKLGDGRRISWRHRIPSKIASSPSLLGRRLYVTAYDRRVYSFDGWSGRLRWQTTAFADDAEVRVLLGLRSLVRRRSWTEGGYYATPAVAYDRMYAGVIDGVFSAFDARTGVHRWSRKLAGSIYGSAAVWKEKVYVGNDCGHLLRPVGAWRRGSLEARSRRKDPRLADGDERPRLHRDDPARDIRLERQDRRDRVAVRRRPLLPAGRRRLTRLPRREGAHLCARGTHHTSPRITQPR